MKIFFTGSNPGLPILKGSILSFASITQDLGHVICDDLNDGPDVLVCVDYHPQFRKIIRQARQLNVPTVLIKQEPSVTAPIHSRQNPGELFDLVIKRGDPREKRIFNTFQEWDTRFLSNPTRKVRAVAINADKWSAVRGEQYSLRRRCYASDSRIDVYGHGWGDSDLKRLERIAKEIVIALRFGKLPLILNTRYGFVRPVNYKGSSDDKAMTLSNYKVSLVIENSSEYMSEKLVDALLAGTIPVYVGPNPLLFGIPNKLFFHSEPDPESISKAISKALEIDTQDFHNNVRSWASNETTIEFWEARKVTDRLLRHIECRIGIPGEGI